MSVENPVTHARSPEEWVKVGRQSPCLFSFTITLTDLKGDDTFSKIKVLCVGKNLDCARIDRQHISESAAARSRKRLSRYCELYPFCHCNHCGCRVLPLRRWNRKKDAFIWQVIALIALLGSVSFSWAYWRSIEVRSAEFGRNTWIAIGERRTDADAMRTLLGCQMTPVVDCATNSGLLTYSQGNPELFCNRESIRVSEGILTALYILSVCLISTSVLATIQIMELWECEVKTTGVLVRGRGLLGRLAVGAKIAARAPVRITPMNAARSAAEFQAGYFSLAACRISAHRLNLPSIILRAHFAHISRLPPA